MISRERGAMLEVERGIVTAFFSRPLVAGIELSGPLKVGDRIRIKGHTTDIEVMVESMEVDNTPATEASPGQAVGIKVSDRVRPGDRVYDVWD